MAALIDEARAVRAEAVRLRGDAANLRREVHRRHREVAVTLAGVRVTCTRVVQRREVGIQSAWSTLSWELPRQQLDHVLTSL